MDFPYDEAKFTELVLYVADQLKDDPAAGATKLNKALYSAESGHVRSTGRPISGAEFQKLPWGPIPRRLVPVRARLLASGDARLEKLTYLGYSQDRLVPQRHADLSVFDDDELESIEQAIAALVPLNATESSELSREEVGWQIVDEGDTIPFETAYLRRPVLTPAIRAHAERLVERLGLRA